MGRNLFFQRIAILLLLPGMGMLFSCSKSSFLDKKPNTDFIIPTTLPDFQALLDNDAVFGRTSALGELSADNLYLRDTFWQGLDAKEHNAYIWAPGDIYGGQGQQDDWDLPYEQVFYANVVLDGLAKVKVDSSNVQDWNALKGAALFTRAYAFYNLAQIFAPVYDNVSAPTDLGIPLRLSPDVNTPSVRASLKQTYSQVLEDLRGADNLLPSTFPFANRNRPSKPAAFAMQARVYLSMRAYDSAKIYADSCLQLYSTLIDYNNTLSTSSNLPFTILNLETIYQSSFFTGSNQSLAAFLYPKCVVDSVLYASYAPADLRSQIFYRINSAGVPNIKGSYNGSIYPFSGLATDEVYLVRAECQARAGDKTGALSDLNTLLVKRWNGSFTPVTATTATEALDTILVERRKELAFRGLRWTDLRRLNKEGANITLTRLLFGQTYQLPPNSPYYVLPIPPDVIALSGIQQNQRP
ncbi:MAG TPA: RagB/SusD family nutrient uptake outer membrane protein [Puia sp.]|nr:RagB/SusD family nutrient uptake outer membrane protein [Puia sp.]